MMSEVERIVREAADRADARAGKTAPERTPLTNDETFAVEVNRLNDRIAALEQELREKHESALLLAEQLVERNRQLDAAQRQAREMTVAGAEAEQRRADAGAEVERLRQKLASTEGALDAYARELERLRTERDESIDGIREALTMLNNDDTTGAIRRLFRLQDRYALTEPEGAQDDQSANAIR